MILKLFKLLSRLLLVCTLASCGGDSVDSGNGSSTSSGAGTPSGGPGATTETQIGGATVVTTLQSDVLVLSDTNAVAATAKAAIVVPNLVQTSNNTFIVPNLPDGFKVGAKFIFNDRPYVIAEISQPPGPFTVTTRAGAFHEILTDLTITGTLNFSDFDVENATVDIPAEAADVTPTLSQQFSAKTPKLPRISLPRWKGVECTYDNSTGDHDLSCDVTFTVKGVDFSGVFGIKQAVIYVDMDYRSARKFVKIESATPYMGGKVALSQDGQAGGKERPLARIKLPLANTFGFARLEIPISVEMTLPFTDISYSFTHEFHYADEQFSVLGESMSGITAKPANINTGQSNVFFGGKAGLVFVVAPGPLSYLSVLGLWGNDDEEESLASVGGLIKFGYAGQLLMTPVLGSSANTFCFGYTLMPATGFAVQTDLNIALNHYKATPFETLVVYPPGRGKTCP